MSLVQDLYEEYETKSRPARVARSYAEGNNVPPFASVKMREHYQWLLDTAKTNLCGSVVDVYTNRTRLLEVPQGVDQVAVHHDVYCYGHAAVCTYNGHAWHHPGSQFAWVNDGTILARVWKHGDDKYIALFDGVRCVTYRRDDGLGADTWSLFEEQGGVPMPVWFEAGDSILADVYPIQDELDYLTAATLIGVDRVAMPLWYILSAQATALQSNRKVDLDPVRESILAITGDSAGAFPEPNTDKLLALQQHAMEKIYATVGIPSYMLKNTGDVPSGAALQIMSERMVNTVQNTSEKITEAWEQLFSELRFGEPVQWESPQLTTDEDKMNRVKDMRELGLPAELWLRELGFDPDEVMSDGRKLSESVNGIGESISSIGQAFFAGE